MSEGPVFPDNVTPSDRTGWYKTALTFVLKDNRWMWAVALVVGLFGGNADRAYTYLSEKLAPVSSVYTRLDALESRVGEVEKHGCACSGNGECTCLPSALPTPVAEDVVPKVDVDVPGVSVKLGK